MTWAGTAAAPRDGERRPRPPRPFAEARSLLVGLLLVHAAWGLFYLYRASFVVFGDRVFCLWDDAMISMRYARNLAAGHGLVWNPGHAPVQGFSNPGVTLVMALLHLLPVDALRISLLFQLLGLGCLSLLLLELSRVTELLHPRDGWAGLTAAVLGALCAPLAIWGLQGADVVPVTLVALRGFRSVALGRRLRGGFPVAAFAWLALGIVLRPDTAVLYAVLLAASPWLGVSRRGFWLGAGLLGAIGLGMAAFGLLYYGDPLPNTYYLKATGAPQRLVWQSGLADLAGIVSMLSPWLLGLLGVGLAVFFRRERLAWLALALVLATWLLDVQVGGDWMPQYVSRFACPGLPFLIVLTASVGWRALERLVPHVVARHPLLLALALAALVAPRLAPKPALAEWLQADVTTMWRAENQQNVALGRYLAQHAAPSLRVGLHWAGAPAYFSGRYAIDLLGRSEPRIARMPIRSQRFLPGHSKWDYDYVLGELKPDVILALNNELDLRPDFQRDYLVALPPMGVPFFVRRGSLSMLSDRQLRFLEIPPAGLLRR